MTQKSVKGHLASTQFVQTSHYGSAVSSVYSFVKPLRRLTDWSPSQGKKKHREIREGWLKRFCGQTDNTLRLSGWITNCVSLPAKADIFPDEKKGKVEKEEKQKWMADMQARISKLLLRKAEALWGNLYLIHCNKWISSFSPTGAGQGGHWGGRRRRSQ